MLTRQDLYGDLGQLYKAKDLHPAPSPLNGKAMPILRSAWAKLTVNDGHLGADGPGFSGLCAVLCKRVTGC